MASHRVPIALLLAVGTVCAAAGGALAEPAAVAARPDAVATSTSPATVTSTEPLGPPTDTVVSGATETRKGSGTPGMILRLDFGGDRPVRVWDPALAWTSGKNPRYDPSAGWRTLIDSTVPVSISGSLGTKLTYFGFLPRASWSPDGTRIAYVKAIADSGLAQSMRDENVYTTHTSAIFVYDLLTKQHRQVTFPPLGARFCGAEDDVERPPCTPMLGHLFADGVPTWTADSSRIVFLRYGHTGDDDPLFRDSGWNLWSVPANGGAQTNVTRWDQYSSQRFFIDAVPVPGSNDVIITVDNDYDKIELRRISATASGSNGSVIASFDPYGRLALTDFSVSPDGSELVYGLAPSSQSGRGKAVVVPLNGNGRSRTIANWPGSLARFSPTGNGILRAGCVQRPDGDACGITEFLLDDTGTHDNGKDDERLVYRSDELYRAALAPIFGVRPAYDIQVQQLPVVFLPGFAGSQLQCKGSVEWLSLPVNGLRDLELGPDGRSNANCSGAGPTGKLVEYVARGIGAVYGPSADFVRDSFDGRGSVFGWDWRKSPVESLALLKQHIESVLNQDRYRRQGVRRVTLYGHSYGGLFIRHFIETNPQYVARVLTAGTPYWGSPKAVFPLVFGVESPTRSELDAILPNDDFASLARNLTGMYQLYPARRFGDWLAVDGKWLTMNGVEFFVFAHQGNRNVLAQSYKDRTKLYEGYEDLGGVIDYRSVVGTGLPTFDRVWLTFPPAGSDEEVAIKLALADGDGTVMDRSASQQEKPGDPTLGAPVPVQRVCGVSHMELSGDPQVTRAYQEFLDTGRLPLTTKGCPSRPKKELLSLPAIQ